MKPLVLGVRNAVGLSTLQTLNLIPEVNNIVVADTLNLAQGLYRDDTIPYLVEEDAVVDDVMDIIDRERIDVLFVSEPEYLLKLTPEIETFKEKLMLPLPPEPLMEVVMDKLAINELFEPHCPKIFSLEEVDEDDIDYPVIIRSRFSSLEGGPLVVSNSRDLTYEYEALEGKGKTPIVQEYIGGSDEKEFIVPLMYDEGVLRSIVAINVLEKGWNFVGNLLSSKTIWDDNLCRLAKHIGGKLQDTHGPFTGPLTLYFKEKPRGEFALLKIEPVLWESQVLAAEAGVNYPKLLHDIVTDSVTESVADVQRRYETGVETTRKTIYTGVPRNDVIGWGTDG